MYVCVCECVCVQIELSLIAESLIEILACTHMHLHIYILHAAVAQSLARSCCATALPTHCMHRPFEHHPSP